MKRLIYIVDKSELSDKPAELLVGTLITKDGIVIPNKIDDSFFSSSKGKSKDNKSSEEKERERQIYLNAGMSLASLLFPLPTAIARTVAPAIYSLYQRLMSNDESVTKEELMGSAELFDLQLKKISLGVSEAKAKGYLFQPGHPQINRAYILHPLSDFDENKKNIYIPSDSLDDTLLQERESEMIKLFVTLGATTIRFEKEDSGDAKKVVKGGVQLGSPEGSADIGISISSTSDNTNSDRRTIRLSGKDWSRDSRIDKSSFSWLPFEPSWEAIVFAREHGGCTSANLELKKKTSFSSSSEGKFDIGLGVIKANIGMSTSENEEENITYNVYVEFSNPS